MASEGTRRARSIWTATILGAVFGLAWASAAGAQTFRSADPPGSGERGESNGQVFRSYGKLPLAFEANQGSPSIP